MILWRVADTASLMEGMKRGEGFGGIATMEMVGELEKVALMMSGSLIRLSPLYPSHFS